MRDRRREREQGETVQVENGGKKVYKKRQRREGEQKEKYRENERVQSEQEDKINGRRKGSETRVGKYHRRVFTLPFLSSVIFGSAEKTGRGKVLANKSVIYSLMEELHFTL